MNSLIDETKISKNPKGFVDRLNLLGFKTSLKNCKLIYSHKVLMYEVKVKGFTRYKKLTSEEVFYLRKNLQSGLAIVIDRTFLGFVLWSELIIGEF